jgi:hypothetical protein
LEVVEYLEPIPRTLAFEEIALIEDVHNLGLLIAVFVYHLGVQQSDHILSLVLYQITVLDQNYHMGRGSLGGYKFLSGLLAVGVSHFGVRLRPLDVLLLLEIGEFISDFEVIAR